MRVTSVFSAFFAGQLFFGEKLSAFSGAGVAIGFLSVVLSSVS
jgi:hypothetical protein